MVIRMTKKKDYLLNGDHDMKINIEADINDESPHSVIGSTSNDILLPVNENITCVSVEITEETTCVTEMIAANNNIRMNNNLYTKGTKLENDFGWESATANMIEQRQNSSQRCPWRGITMAIILLLFGSLLIVAGIALISDAFQLKGLDNVTPYLILVFGTLCFIPGAYHLLVACCALRGHERFSFDDIPYFG